MKSHFELINITVKINGKKRTFKKENLSFCGWETQCDSCGSHDGVILEIFDKKKTYKANL